MKNIKPVFVAVLGIAIIALSIRVEAQTRIKDTRHNLSSSSPYKIKAVSENQICIFCHAPHNADSTQVPLWNRNDTTQAFTMATTQNVNWGRHSYADNQPTNTSKKCLSCHDGSIAIGELKNGGPITMTDSGSGKLDGDGSLSNDPAKNPFGTNDLRGGHVISFNYKNFYNDAGLPPAIKAKFIDWNSISAGDRASMFDREGKMQCHTCHDPHNDWCTDSNKTIGKDPLWRKACDGNGNGSVCNTCHNTFSDYTAPNLKF